MVEKDIKVVVKEIYGEKVDEVDEVALKVDLARGDLYSDWNIYRGILYHLVSNSIKFSTKGQRLII